MPGSAAHVDKRQLERLSLFRYQLRRFLRFSEDAARDVGVTLQQYQLMLHTQGFAGRDWASIGELFEVVVGATPSRSEPAYWAGQIPWVSSGEVAFCRIRATRETITGAGLSNSSAKLLPPGTMLLGMIGEGRTRGQAAILGVAAATNQNSAELRVSDTPVAWLSPSLYFAEAETVPRLEAQIANMAALVDTLEPLDAAALARLCPVIRTGPGAAVRGLLDPTGLKLDADALLQSFARQLRTRGGEIRLGQRVEKMERRGDAWIQPPSACSSIRTLRGSTSWWDPPSNALPLRGA